MSLSLSLARSCVLTLLVISCWSVSKAEAQAQAELPPVPTTPVAASTSTLITGSVSHLYVYVEPHQTRVEALFDMPAVFQWLTPDKKELPETLSPTQQAQIVVNAEKLAAEWCSLTMNESKQPHVPPAAFLVKGRPGATLPMQDGEHLAFNQCMLGLVWQFTTNETPDQVEVVWQGWINEIKEMPVTILFGNQSEKAIVNRVIKRIPWMNKGRLRPSPLAAVPTFTPAEPLNVPLGAAIWIIAGIAFYWLIRHRNYRLPGGSLLYLSVWSLGLVLFSKILFITVQRGERAPVITQAAEAQKIVSPLLRNVYRAFDQRAESRVYDVLARSVDGELLRRLYLETITALTLDGREGTRVLITDFEATVDQAKPHPTGDGFIAECQWSVLGNVGHWGHSHPRYNGYKAKLTVQPIKSEWKLTDLEVQEVRRK